MIEYADNASLGAWWNPRDWFNPIVATEQEKRALAAQIVAIPETVRSLAAKSALIARWRQSGGNPAQIATAQAAARDAWIKLRRLNDLAIQLWDQARRDGKVENIPAPTVSIDTGEESLGGAAFWIGVGIGGAMILVGVAALILSGGLAFPVVAAVAGAVVASLGAVTVAVAVYSNAAQTPTAPGGGSAPGLPTMAAIASPILLIAGIGVALALFGRRR